MTFFDPTKLNELLAVLPEIVLVIWALAILAFDLLSARGVSRRALGILTALGLMGALVACVPAALTAASYAATDPTKLVVLGGLVRFDLYAFAFRGIFIVGAALTALVSIDFRAARAGGEYYALLLLATVGMGLMAASNDLMLLYLATETASISLYLLAGFMRDTKLSAEAGIKYFVFGAVTSTIMLFGLSYVFGLSGATQYQVVADRLALSDSKLLLTFSLLLVAVGFLFKTSTVPFQWWAPDVYQGAPTPVAGFISTASKAAGFAIMLRFLPYVFSPVPSHYVEGSGVWIAMMVPLAILTMLVGNLMAINQSNVKRMLAYSSIAQAGYMLIGVAGFAASFGQNTAETTNALAAVIFYLITYTLTNIGAFAVTGIVAQRVGGDDFKDFAGLSRRSPYLALAMVAVMLSLLGAPPLVGFAGKFLLFRSALSVAAQFNNPVFIWLVVLAVAMVLVSVFYYLRVVLAMYTQRAANDAQPLKVSAPVAWAVGLCAFGVIATLLAIYPLWELARAAALSLML
ncbi:MAG: NADH-quinone oxidoreductase subunit N [Thermoflexales bacterium]|nr:NADH-quinone oxidoreductase subunit N [Thermoflexales bacterium]